MSLTEIAYRGRQEAAKAFERFAPAGRAADADEWARAHAPSLTESDVALQVVRDARPSLLRWRRRGVHRRTAAGAIPGGVRADRRDGRRRAGRPFRPARVRGLSFGLPIDWHLDPVWSKRAPLMHWSRLNPLDAATVGDSKVVWELNRQQWLVRMAQAWVVTRDTRYAAACIEQFYAWLEANPPGMGMNWTSSLEASYRLMSWSWMMLLIRDWPGLTNRCVRDVLVSVWRHAIFVRRHLSYYFSPNTHLTGEALGLVHAGLVFPFYREAADWRAVGLRVLVEECGRQVHADGVHFEQSTCYQRYSAETYLTLLTLAARNAVALPREVAEQTARMVNVLAALQRPDGTMPAIGDADGGHLLPITQRGPADSRGTCALGAAMFARADFAWAARGVRRSCSGCSAATGCAASKRSVLGFRRTGCECFLGLRRDAARVAEGTHQ
jgi:hypothetical protein